MKCVFGRLCRSDANTNGLILRVYPTAALGPHPLAGHPGKRLDPLRRDSWPLSFYRALGPVSVGAGLIAVAALKLPMRERRVANHVRVAAVQ
jgi:hypothetical protein